MRKITESYIELSPAPSAHISLRRFRRFRRRFWFAVFTYPLLTRASPATRVRMCVIFNKSIFLLLLLLLFSGLTLTLSASSSVRRLLHSHEINGVTLLPGCWQRQKRYISTRRQRRHHMFAHGRTTFKMSFVHCSANPMRATQRHAHTSN